MSIAAVAMLAFAPLAAVMAFLVTYEEYRRHKLPGRQLLAKSVEAAAVTLAFFAALAALVGLLAGGLFR